MQQIAEAIPSDATSFARMCVVSAHLYRCNHRWSVAKNAHLLHLNSDVLVQRRHLTHRSHAGRATGLVHKGGQPLFEGIPARECAAGATHADALPRGACNNSLRLSQWRASNATSFAGDVCVGNMRLQGAVQQHRSCCGEPASKTKKVMFERCCNML